VEGQGKTVDLLLRPLTLLARLVRRGRFHQSCRSRRSRQPKRTELVRVPTDVRQPLLLVLAKPLGLGQSWPDPLPRHFPPPPLSQVQWGLAPTCSTITHATPTRQPHTSVGTTASWGTPANIWRN
jgi:hypothetical protein